jgi:signal transduction histidine kinase
MSSVSSHEPLPDAGVRPVAISLDAYAEDRLFGSVLSRARQSSLGVVVVAAVAAACLALLDIGVSTALLSLWLGSVLAMIVLRWQVANRAEPALAREGLAAAVRFDRHFRVLSVITQAVAGGGVWLAWGVESEVAGYVMTLLVLLFGHGVSVNLAHDARTFYISAPVLMAHPTLYWLFQGVEGLPGVFSSMGILVLMMSSVRSSQEQFDQGLRIRHEKNALLREIDQKNVALEAALADVERANRAKGFFLATASHDVRQPIIAATLLGEAVQQLPLPEDAQRGLADQGVMLRETQVLLENLLDLARFEEGVVTTDMRPLALEGVFGYLRATHAHACETRGLRLAIPETPLWVRSDRELLQRLLGNLLSNAVNYTRQGMVSLQVEQVGECVRVSVSDTGVGIAAGDVQRMFEPFVRIHGAIESKAKGAGLGLAIVRGIAVVLDVELAVESRVGAGTRVSFLLPAAPPATRADEDAVVQRLGLHDRLRGAALWVVGAPPERLRELDAELLQLGCMCMMPADVGECQALFADGEVPDLLLVEENIATHGTQDELLHWLATTLPAAPVLVLTDDAPERLRRRHPQPQLRGLTRPARLETIIRWLTRNWPDAQPGE